MAVQLNPSTQQYSLPQSEEPFSILWTYHTPLVKERKIEVISAKGCGLQAIVHRVDGRGEELESSVPLPLLGLPKELCQEHRIREWLMHSHLIPEKGVDGAYNRVTAHVSGVGGGKPSIPFQPGLALGSVVRGDTIAKMEEYATKIAALEAREKQIQTAEENIERLQAKIDLGKPPALVPVWKKQIEAEKKRIERLVEEIGKSGGGDEIPIFENFYSGIETPIDMANSALDVQPRGFDSINFNSQYINMREDISEIHDRVSHASSASQVSGSGGFWFVSVQASHAWGNATSTRLAQIQKSGIAQGVLVINAVVTTRNVRCFPSLQFDRAKLKQILSAMESDDAKLLNRYGITVSSDKKTKEIYLLTEAVLGGSFTALVTFLDTEKMNRRIDKKSEEHNSSSSVSVGVWGYSASYAQSSASGFQSEDDVLRGVSSTKVSIEMISQGAMPSFTKGVIEHEIMKHLDLNPSKFELSAQDTSDAKILAKGKDEEKIDVLAKRQLKMQNAGVAAMNTYRGLAASKDKQQLHTPSSVLEAYDSFADKMATDQDCGVPIGFNYQRFTQEDLKDMLRDLESQRSILPAPAGEDPGSTDMKDPEEKKSNRGKKLGAL